MNGKHPAKTKTLLPTILFLLGFGIFMATRASNFIPHWSAGIAVAPIFVLAFGRSLPARRGKWLTLAGFLLSCNIAMWGLFELDTPAASMIYSLIRNSVIGLLFSLPYLADRSLYPKLRALGGWSTLSFPIAQTAVIFLVSLEGPFDGDMISAVYGSFGGMAIRQIASLFGLFGFAFAYSWFASIVNFFWEQRLKWAKIKSITLSVSIALVAIILFGVVKISAPTRYEKDTVKAAAIILLPEPGEEFDQEGLFSRESSNYEADLSKIDSLTAEATSHGAKIVAFQESAIKVNENSESRLMADLMAIAGKHRVYFSIGYGVFPAEGKGWNKAVLITETGEVGVDYRKRYLLGFGDFGETRIYNKGPEIIQSVDSPYGIIAVSICRDMSFPAFARQAGAKRVDIMLNPSYDVPKSGGAMYSLRAVENGFSMLRPVYNGYSYAVDFNGELLAGMDSDLTDSGIMYAMVPTKGINTLYTVIGDMLGLICVVGLLAFVPLNIVLRRRQKQNG